MVSNGVGHRLAIYIVRVTVVRNHPPIYATTVHSHDGLIFYRLDVTHVLLCHRLAVF